MNWEDLNWEKSYDKNKAYAQSKLANVLHAKELARRAKDVGIVAFSVHPGLQLNTITFPGLDNLTVSDTTQPSLQTSVYFVTNRNLFEGFVKTDIGRNNEGCCLRGFMKLSASTIQLNTLQGAKATLVRELHKERLW